MYICDGTEGIRPAWWAASPIRIRSFFRVVRQSRANLSPKRTVDGSFDARSDAEKNVWNESTRSRTGFIRPLGADKPKGGR